MEGLVTPAPFLERILLGHVHVVFHGEEAVEFVGQFLEAGAQFLLRSGKVLWRHASRSLHFMEFVEGPVGDLRFFFDLAQSVFLVAQEQ